MRNLLLTQDQDHQGVIVQKVSPQTISLVRITYSLGIYVNIIKHHPIPKIFIYVQIFSCFKILIQTNLKINKFNANFPLPSYLDISLSTPSFFALDTIHLNNKSAKNSSDVNLMSIHLKVQQLWLQSQKIFNTYWLQQRETVCFVDPRLSINAYRQSRVHKTYCFPEVKKTKFIQKTFYTKHLKQNIHKMKHSQNMQNICGFGLSKGHMFTWLCTWFFCYSLQNNTLSPSHADARETV